MWATANKAPSAAREIVCTLYQENTGLWAYKHSTSASLSKCVGEISNAFIDISPARREFSVEESTLYNTKVRARTVR